MRDLSKYPDTGETGETYDLEFEETEPDSAQQMAVEKAQEFLRQQGHYAEQPSPKVRR